MEVRNASENDIVAAADEVGVRVHGLRRTGQGFAFTLRTGEHAVVYEVGADGRPKRTRPRYTRTRQRPTSSTGKFATVGGAVCWHGHRDYLRALYRRAPSAVVRTALAKYLNAAHFEAAHESTQSATHTPPGALEYGAACHCAEDELLLATGPPSLCHY